jgi:hypothetical protein
MAQVAKNNRRSFDSVWRGDRQTPLVGVMKALGIKIRPVAA